MLLYKSVCVLKVLYVTGQSTLHYILQCLLFTTWLSCRSGDRGIISVLRCRGWRYMLLALVDVEANYLLVTAHQFTTLTSIQVTPQCLYALPYLGKVQGCIWAPAV